MSQFVVIIKICNLSKPMCNQEHGIWIHGSWKLACYPLLGSIVEKVLKQINFTIIKIELKIFKSLPKLNVSDI